MKTGLIGQTRSGRVVVRDEQGVVYLDGREVDWASFTLKDHLRVPIECRGDELYIDGVFTPVGDPGYDFRFDCELIESLDESGWKLVSHVMRHILDSFPDTRAQREVMRAIAMDYAEALVMIWPPRHFPPEVQASSHWWNHIYVMAWPAERRANARQ